MLDTNPFATQVTLLRRLCDLRNDRAWQTFLDRYRPLLRRWCRERGLRTDDAEEVTASVVAKLVQEMGRYVHDPARGRFRGWLKTLVQRQVIDFWRRCQRTPGRRSSDQSGGADFLEQFQDPASLDALADQFDERLQRDVARAERLAARIQARVGPVAWEAFRLTQVENVSCAEAAAQLNVSLRTVYMARDRIKKMLAEERALG